MVTKKKSRRVKPFKNNRITLKEIRKAVKADGKKI